MQSADVRAIVSDQQGCLRMQEWLRQHAGDVGSMHLACKARKEQPLLQLAYADLTQLQSLSLKRLQLAFCSSSASMGCMQEQAVPSAAAASGAGASPSSEDSPSDAAQVTAAGASWLPQLLRLKLKHCTLRVSSLQLLSRISSLTSLQLHGLQLVSTGAADGSITPAQVSTAICCVLQQLPALADLALGTSECHVLYTHSPADLPALQRLTLGGGFAGGTLAGLPAGITYLHLQPCGSRCLHVDPGATELMQLSKLQHLRLSKATIPAALLLQLTMVQRITFDDAWAAALGNEGQMHLRKTSRQALQLLAACKRLQRLRHLEFKYMNDSSVVSALGVLTQLTALEVTEQGMPSERGALHKALQQKLPQLRLLRLVAEPQPSGPPRTYSWDHRDKPSCLDGSDMRSIAEHCPNLEHLALREVVGPSVFSGCIQTLSVLQTLCVSGAAYKDSVSAAVAQMSSLKAVHWSDSPLTVAGLQRLTALTALTRLEVTRCPAVAGLLGTAMCSGHAANSGAELALQCADTVS
jgi:hypothetical protein